MRISPAPPATCACHQLTTGASGCQAVPPMGCSLCARCAAQVLTASPNAQVARPGVPRVPVRSRDRETGHVLSSPQAGVLPCVGVLCPVLPCPCPVPVCPCGPCVGPVLCALCPVSHRARCPVPRRARARRNVPATSTFAPTRPLPPGIPQGVSPQGGPPDRPVLRSRFSVRVVPAKWVVREGFWGAWFCAFDLRLCNRKVL